MVPMLWYGRNVKEHTISMKLVVDFGPIQGNTYTLAETFAPLVTITNTNQYAILIVLKKLFLKSDPHFVPQRVNRS